MSIIFDWVGKNNLLGADVPGFHAVSEHGLSIGDKVSIMDGTGKYSGEYTVLKASADDDTFAGTMFLIDAPWGGSSSGSFTKVGSITDSASKELVDKLRNGSERYSPPNAGEGGGVVAPNTPGSQTDSTGPSNITYYVIGGVALLSLILILRK